jgi:hypothetical protein
MGSSVVSKRCIINPTLGHGFIAINTDSVLEQCKSQTGTLRAYQRSDLLAGHNFANVAAMIQVEDDDGEIVIFAE